MATYPPNTIPENGDDQQLTLKKILAALTGGAGGSGSPGIPVTQPIVAPTIALKTAGQSGTIPAGAKGWTFTVITGTATFGGAAVPAGFSDSDANTLAAAISYSFDTPGTGYVRWNT